MKTIKLIKYHIFTEDDLEWLTKDCDIDKKDVKNLNKGDLDTDYDYAITALVDENTKKVIENNDNIHGKPDLFIQAFIQGLQYSGECKIDFSEKYIMEDDFKNKYNE